MKHLANLLMKQMLACILAIAAGSAQTQAADSAVTPSAVTAIDVLLDPDATMLRHSEANNARLLVETWDSAAFVTAPDDPIIDPALIS